VRTGADSTAPTGLLVDLWRALSRKTLVRLAPFLVVTGVYAILRDRATPDFLAETRQIAEVGRWSYLLTQIAAGWYYLFRWFVPVELVADYAAYPWIRSAADPRVLGAVAGWLGVAWVLRATYRRRPQYVFLALAALALLSPTSSVAPLAEAVNEHRPYLPLGVLSLAWLVPGLVALDRATEPRPAWRIAGLGAVLLVLGGLGWLTTERNRAFATQEAYWVDIQQKAPSARSALNHGVVLMARGELAAALEQFHASLKLAPNWHTTHINLGVAYQHIGQLERAEHHFDLAVRLDQHSALALTHRGHHHLARGRYQAAMADFEAALPIAREQVPVLIGMATALAGLGHWEPALARTREAYGLDPQRTENSIVAISRPFWLAPERFAAGIRYYEGLLPLLPNRWWIHHNIGQLAGKLGRSDQAREHLQKAAALRPASP